MQLLRDGILEANRVVAGVVLGLIAAITLVYLFRRLFKKF
jgi:hypothetical protein